MRGMFSKFSVQYFLISSDYNNTMISHVCKGVWFNTSTPFLLRAVLRSLAIKYFVYISELMIILIKTSHMSTFDI